jgi:NAD(P)-dependent dehydrogenase (short-subunit alcohol dehydrogenase family)
MFDFKNKTALVTGATHGIGLAIAQKLAAASGHVLINSESEADCETLANRLASQGYQATPVAADMSEAQQVVQLAERISRDFSQLNVMFLNAGITCSKRFGDENYEEDVDQVFKINLHAPRLLCDRLLPTIAQNSNGAAVLTSSLSSLRGNKNIGVYSLTKSAIAQLAKDMAVKFGPQGVRVNALSPGLIATGWESKVLSNPEAAARRMQMTPLRRVGQPDEIANAALFLASDLASFVTGHNLVADGGTAITDGN